MTGNPSHLTIDSKWRDNGKRSVQGLAVLPKRFFPLLPKDRGFSPSGSGFRFFVIGPKMFFWGGNIWETWKWQFRSCSLHSFFERRTYLINSIVTRLPPKLRKFVNTRHCKTISFEKPSRCYQKRFTEKLTMTVISKGLNQAWSFIAVSKRTFV